MLSHLSSLSYLLRIGTALVASILLLAGPPALGSYTQCSSEWEESSASETCKDVSIQWGDWNNCEPCCMITAKCNNGNRFDPDPWDSTIIGVPLSDVDDLENCWGDLTNGSC